MNILDLIIKETGNVYTRKASTHGGEFAGPCPFCGGEDRFSIHPEKDHYVCRRCKKAGDKIEFLKKYSKMSYVEACKALDVLPKFKFSSLDASKDKPGQNEIKWKPIERVLPNESWQRKAEAFLFEKFKFLMSHNGSIQRRWLNNRGLMNETIKKARIGYNNFSVNFDAESWGLSSERSIWLPEGLIIPQFYNGKLIRLRIRQSDITAKSRFIVVKGSSGGFFNYDDHVIHESMNNQNKKPWIITESELDGWLLHQESNGACKVFAAGGSSIRPDIETHEYIKENPGLINLDNDESGSMNTKWFLEKYPHIIQHVSMNKDPGEDFKEGINVLKWLNAGISKIKIPNNINKLEKTAGKIDFKQEVINRYKNKIKTNKPEQNQPIIKSVEVPQSIKPSKLCFHGQYCVSMKENVCLINKLKPFDTLFCPLNKWYIWREGSVLEVIYGPGYKK